MHLFNQKDSMETDVTPNDPLNQIRLMVPFHCTTVLEANRDVWWDILFVCDVWFWLFNYYLVSHAYLVRKSTKSGFDTLTRYLY